MAVTGWLRGLLLGALALGQGWAGAGQAPTPAPSGAAVAPPQGAFAELNAEQAYAAWRGGVLFLDARLGTDYAYGHIPGALSLSLRDPGFAQRLKALLAGAKGKPTQPVVVYCSGCCSTDSLFLAQSLKESGFTSIRNYRDGFPGWARAGYPRAVGEQPNALEVR